jgi:hypothetical protein
MAKESSSNRKPAKPQQRKTKSADVSRDLDARQQDIDKVKGGKKKLEDPCQGGEMGIIRR